MRQTKADCYCHDNMRHTDTGTRHIKVNILYKTVKPFKGVLMAKCKNRAIGARNAPSWKKKCFQLGKLFFPTGNLKKQNPHDKAD